eukprot:2466598-Prymnesium_polylepis.2
MDRTFSPHPRPTRGCDRTTVHGQPGSPSGQPGDRIPGPRVSAVSGLARIAPPSAPTQLKTACAQQDMDTWTCMNGDEMHGMMNIIPRSEEQHMQRLTTALRKWHGIGHDWHRAN